MNILNDEIFYNDDGGMGKYIVNKLQLPPAQADPETVKKYERYGKNLSGCTINAPNIILQMLF